MPIPSDICPTCSYRRRIQKSKEFLCTKLLKRISSKTSHCLFYTGELFPVDVVIITAVSVELDAVFKHLLPDTSGTWNEFPSTNVGLWHQAVFTSDQQQGPYLRIVVTKLSQMGMAAAAAKTAIAIDLFKPSYVMMVGIAAGKEEKTDFGDIVIPCTVWDYGAGKIGEDKEGVIFHPRARPRPVNQLFIDQSESIGRDKAFLAELHTSWFGQQETKIAHPRVLTSPLVSGAAVVDSNMAWDAIVQIDDTVVALEMEAFGVAYAVSMYTGPYKPEYLIAKSVCDFGKLKTKDHQKYASYTSVRFLREFLIRYVIVFNSKSHPDRQNVFVD